MPLQKGELKMKKLLSAILVGILTLSLVCFTACTSGGNDSSSASNSDSQEIVGKHYTVGICQYIAHPALDAASEGFKASLTAALEKEGCTVTFRQQSADGQFDLIGTIINGFVSEKVDLILANATPVLQVAANATDSIPILGTSITEYGVALDIDNFNGVVGGNISGTSDLAPLTEQAKIMAELLPNAQKIGILYCSAEPNSVYQANVVKAELEKLGKTVSIHTFSDSNDIQMVVTSAADKCDAIYVPTDNTVAANTEIVNNICGEKNIPVFAGEEGICKGCGFATLSISYYKLGEVTGEMAARVLLGKEDISTMAIEYDNTPVKKYIKSVCEALGIVIPENAGYEEIVEE